MTTYLDDARRYAALGWCILPMRWTRDDRKCPAVPWKQFQTRRPTDAEMVAMFSKRGVKGLGVLAGPVSGDLCVRDFDDASAYVAWAERYRDLAMTLPTVRTHRGYHVYFTALVGRVVPLGDGELRGADFCVLPPSEHPKGGVYGWIIEPTAAPLPVIDPVMAGLAPEGFERHGHKTAQRQHKPTQANSKSVVGGGGGVQEQAETTNAAPSTASSAPPDFDDDMLDRIVRAIKGSTPTQPGERNKLVWKLARTLKGIDDIAGVPAGELRFAVELWHKEALPFISTKEFELTWSDFLRAWPKVKYPRGRVMETIRKQALSAPLPVEGERYGSDELRLLVKVCRELQRLAGDAPFFLAVRMAGELIGCGHTRASELLRVLVGDGILAMVKVGEAKGRRATEFRYIGDAPASQYRAAAMNALSARLATRMNTKRPLDDATPP